MFTTGIFSSHLPYIAFVFFYAFFFLFNIQHNTAEAFENKVTESNLSVVYNADSKYYEISDVQDEKTVSAINQQYLYQYFSQKKRSGLYTVHDEPFIKDKFFSENFSRPPPLK
jgi:hypothetical protein